MGAGLLTGDAGTVPGNFSYSDGRLHCEGVPVEALTEEHGTPLYAYSRRSIVDRLHSLDAAFEPLDRLIAYSVKANGNLSLLRLLADGGCGADIVSGGELHRALKAGIPADRIVFSGVGKTVPEMEAALDAGILCFNVESEGELRALGDLAAARGVAAPISLRINPDIESPTPHAYTRTGHRATKFGVGTEHALDLYRLARDLPGLDPIGIDAHIGSQILEPEPYRQSLLHLLDLVHELKGEEIELRQLDLGGGFGVAYDAESDPDPSVFADRLLPHLATSGLKLILEPGRYVIGHAGVLLTRVLYVKRTGEKTFVITDAGMNDLLRPSHYSSYHRVEPASLHAEGAGGPADQVALEPEARERGRVDVVGPICESGDFLALDREMTVPRPGELLAIHTTGAYGFSMASTYNARPRPAEVLVEGESFRLIRRRETYDDLVRGEEDLLIE